MTDNGSNREGEVRHAGVVCRGCTERKAVNASREGVEHVWEPTTETHAVYKCARCQNFAFSPHVIPKFGCTPEPVDVS